MATKKKSAPKKKVAAKKATAKKTVVKKAAPKKKAAAKKAPARKPAPVKKAVAKKLPVKKAAPKKKAPVKKSAVKKSAVKKSSAKKAPAKRPVTKKVAVRSTASVSTSPIALLERPRTTFTSTPAVETKPVITREPVVAPEIDKKKKKSSIGYFLAFGAVVLIATAIATNSDSSSQSSEPTPQASASQTTSEEPTATVELGAPLDVFADYTPTGGKVTWKAPTTVDQVTGYLVQSSYRGGAFKTIATIEASALSHEVMKIDTPGFTTFRVVAVYGDQEVASDVSELKGQYEG